MLRQQEVIADSRPNRSLADFIAPRDSGVPDYLGMFAVTAGHRRRRAGAPLRAGPRRLQRDHGQGARRPAGRGVRRVPARAGAQGLGLRRAASSCRNDDLIAEKYRGIRPAYGYPACPDHSEKFKLFELLDARTAGDHADRERRDAAGGERQRAVLLASRRRSTSTSGGIGRDQLESYATRKGDAVEEVERWLAPNLPYDPAAGRQRPERAAPPAAYRAGDTAIECRRPILWPDLAVGDLPGQSAADTQGRCPTLSGV